MLFQLPPLTIIRGAERAYSHQRIVFLPLPPGYVGVVKVSDGSVEEDRESPEEAERVERDH